jgi:hypothetical protein
MARRAPVDEDERSCQQEGADRQTAAGVWRMMGRAGTATQAVFSAYCRGWKLSGTARRTRVGGNFAPVPLDRLFQPFWERH